MDQQFFLGHNHNPMELSQYCEEIPYLYIDSVTTIVRRPLYTNFPILKNIKLCDTYNHLLLIVWVTFFIDVLQNYEQCLELGKKRWYIHLINK